jgi:hypothetical protein
MRDKIKVTNEDIIIIAGWTYVICPVIIFTIISVIATVVANNII